MSGRGRPVGPEGRVSPVQVVMDDDSRMMMLQSKRGAPAMLRHALRMQHAHDQFLHYAVPNDVVNATSLAIVRDLTYHCWRVLSPAARFTVRVVTLPANPRGPVFVQAENAVFPFGSQEARDLLEHHRDLVTMYSVTERFVAPDAGIDFDMTYRSAILRISQNPEAMWL
ncbi:hypothetical protein [Deinococcus soli (ex Cha et al. 2016)]|uniref:Uncharacterized protein n=1 Tax=Deinococcus soli (ex Cha et al. 2016) TaxID=1309411 RepID=A0ACC6KPI9_9DEIO|nr:hypothetical protein [Deinococcus soli (ex Cha et al. 2016)]MDR6330593.1 hypothetical protein [Deinococcus soli (ex Cha et al. 2016)]MDR6754370.1 hypothetical protein [Deinococcus soli (ex Cha et al. 2016)]